MSPSRPTVCVVGGGISGLVAAHSLSSHEHPPIVTVLEASDRLGGAIRTDVIDGVEVEAGADSFLTRTPDAVELCDSVGLGDELIAPAVFGASILRDGRLVGLSPDFVFGLPVSARAALRAGHLSRPARIRAALEPLLPGPVVSTDISVAEIVRRRFGSAVLDQSVDPLLAGTRAGRPEDMSFEAALPHFWALVRGNRSITRALARGRARNLLPSGAPPFQSVRGGLGRLIDALRDRSGDAEFRTRVAVERIEGGAGKAVVHTNSGRMDCDAVVVATPSHEAARLLGGLNPQAATLLGAIDFASTAIITLVYPPGSRRDPLPGSGMLVPSRERTIVSACTWYSIKWPHATPAGGGLVLRCFVGRAGENPALELPDEELSERAAREVGRALALTVEPRAARVTRWHRALPQYAVGHVRRVESIESMLEATPRVWVTGASYRGSGIPDCIKQGRATAARVLDWLGP